MSMLQGPSRYRPAIVEAGMAVLAFVILAASPFLYRAWRSPSALQLTKIALVTAFTGPEQAQGQDASAAVQLAIQDANGGHRSQNRLYVLSAFDDRGLPDVALDQARAVAADPGVSAVLCCGAPAAVTEVQSILPVREHLYSLSANPTAEAQAEAALATDQFGTVPVALLTDDEASDTPLTTALVQDFQAHGASIRQIHFDFATGSDADQIAEQVSDMQPGLIAFDMSYPNAAIVASALRKIGEDVPILGDSRLDSAPAALLLAGVMPWWYVAPNRDTLARRTPATFDARFLQLRGHQASANDYFAYLETLSAIGQGTPPVLDAQIYTLYQGQAENYPGKAVRSAVARGDEEGSW